MAFLTENLLWFALIPVAFALVFVIKKYWPSYSDDNIVEEKIEEVIKNKTGLNLDLTPSSPEPEKPKLKTK